MQQKHLARNGEAAIGLPQRLKVARYTMLTVGCAFVIMSTWAFAWDLLHGMASMPWVKLFGESDLPRRVLLVVILGAIYGPGYLLLLLAFQLPRREHFGGILLALAPIPWYYSFSRETFFGNSTVTGDWYLFAAHLAVVIIVCLTGLLARTKRDRITREALTRSALSYLGLLLVGSSVLWHYVHGSYYAFPTGIPSRVLIGVGVVCLCAAFAGDRCKPWIGITLLIVPLPAYLLVWNSPNLWVLDGLADGAYGTARLKCMWLVALFMGILSYVVYSGRLVTRSPRGVSQRDESE